MDRNEKERIIDEVVAWCEKRGIGIHKYSDWDNPKWVQWPELDMLEFAGCYIRVGDLTPTDNYLAADSQVVVLHGYTAEEIERAIEEYERDAAKLEDKAEVKGCV